MISPRKFALAITLVAGALIVLPAPAHAQVRGGGRGASGGARLRSSFGAGRGRFARPLRSSDGYIFYPDFLDYGYGSGYEYGSDRQEPRARPMQMGMAQPNQPAAAAAPAKPAESLIIEEHDGRWMRVPTGNQLPMSSKAAQTDFGPVPSHPGYLESHDSTVQAKLPPAVLVFRDGHQEQVAKYVIRDNAVYVDTDYWTTGSWTREIPLSQLDLPASKKMNAERGAKFSLPTRPNEVVVRF